MQRDELKIAKDDFLIGNGNGFEAPKIHSEWQRNLRDAHGVVRRRERKGLKNVRGCADRFEATHDGANDARGRPLEASSGERGAVWIVGEVVFHGTKGFIAG